MDNQILSIKPRSGYGFIYCYTSPSNKKYIGQTKTTLKERAKLNAKGYKGCTAFYNAIQKYGWDNFKVEILEEPKYDELDDVEVYYINLFNTTNPKKGYNIMTNKQNYLATLVGIPVFRYDGITGEYINSYPTISQAEREMNVHKGSIRRILNQLNHHVRGSVWMTTKVDKIPIVQNNLQPTSQQVHMYDSKSGIFIKSFISLREAAKCTGYNRAVIKNALKDRSIKITKHKFRTFKVDNLYDESSTTIRNGVGSSEPKEE